MLAQVNVVPLGVGVSISRYVADALAEIDRSGIDYRLTAMGTILEGDWNQIMNVLKKVHDRLLTESDRILMNISLDDRKDKLTTRIEAKVEAVEEALGRTLKK
jgi:uncharacterized protein (TIGR00106 family)